MHKNKTIKMIFKKDQVVDGVMVAKADHVSEMEILNEGSIQRWLLRGGEIVELSHSKKVEEKKNVVVIPDAISQVIKEDEKLVIGDIPLVKADNKEKK